MARGQPQTHQQAPQLDPLADPVPAARAPELASQAEASVAQNQALAQQQVEGGSVKSSLDALDISLDDDILLEVDLKCIFCQYHHWR